MRNVIKTLRLMKKYPTTEFYSDVSYETRKNMSRARSTTGYFRVHKIQFI